MNKVNDYISKSFRMISFHDQKYETSNAIEYKLVILGERGVGKTSICNRLLKNEFNLEIKSTTQNDCYWKIFHLFEKTIYLYVLDIEDNFLTTERANIYSDLDGAILVYDVTKAKTFEDIDKWAIELKQHTQETIPFILLGNKIDLSYLRNVDIEEGNKKALELNCDFFETSCIDDKSLIDKFKFLISKIYFDKLTDEEKNNLKYYCDDQHHTSELEKTTISNEKLMNGEKISKQFSEDHEDIKDNFNSLNIEQKEN